MILFAERVSARLEYVMSFIGLHIQGCPVSITTSREEYLRHDGPKINYSAAPVAGREIRMLPHGLLWENGISPQQVTIDSSDPQFRFFLNDSDTGFDLLSAVFFLISRYEEYLPHTKDSYGRYAHENSIAWKNGFIDVPVVDRWICSLYRQLQQLQATGLQQPDVMAPESGKLPPVRTFRFIPTYDIDIAFSYRNKGFIRNAAGFAKSILVRDFSSLSRRLAVLMQRKQDPFDSFQWLDTLHKTHQLRPEYFFLLAARNSIYDRNISPASPAMQNLVREVAAKYNTGIHPSWRSGDETMLVMEEIKTLGGLSGADVTQSRQHYIRLSLPGTYRNLQACGIIHEYSMGYGSINGFRASTCSSFYWYDLGLEKQTALTVHPFCFMDANSFYEQHLDPAKALEEMMHYYRVIKEVGGKMITIWHNHFLGTDPQFSGWREVYEKFVKAVSGA